MDFILDVVVSLCGLLLWQRFEDWFAYRWLYR